MNSTEMAQEQLQAKLASLSKVGQAISMGAFIDPDTEEIVLGEDQGDSPWDYLAELVLEVQGDVTDSTQDIDFVLCLGGPNVWLRNAATVHTEYGTIPNQWFLMANANGLDQLTSYAITGRADEDALVACESLLDERVFPR